MPESTTHQLEEDRRQGFVDRLLKKLMPNGTVMRRFITGSWMLKIILGTVLILLIEKVDDNASKTARAVCPVISYAEQQAQNIEQRDGVGSPSAIELRQLGTDMRRTGVRCPPPPRLR